MFVPKKKKKYIDLKTDGAVQGPFVEFFNPKMRRELEKKDEEVKKTTGKGNAPGGDEWSYLTSFSRVPVS